MIIPETFKTSISKVFYDKTFNVYSKTSSTDNEGWASINGTSVISDSFAGNIRFNKLDKIKQDYGITEQIDAVITTSSNIALETIIGYSGRQYKVIRNIPHDSHYFLIVQKWLSKSSGYLSA